MSWKILDLNEIYYVDFWKNILGEFITSIYLVFVAVGTGLVDTNPTILKIALTVGPLAAILIVISDGGHFNPALTIALCVAGDISLIRCGIYIVAQTFGSKILMTF